VMGDVIYSEAFKAHRRNREARRARETAERRRAVARVLAPAVEALERYFETGLPPADWPTTH
jgi:hypothetical protein